MTSSDASAENYDFDELADMYHAHGALNPPAEFHGLLCGKLVGGAQLPDERILAMLIDHMGVEKLQEKESGELVLDIFERMQQGLRAEDMSFRPLLPDDEFALSERVDALSCWTRGFLEGIALQLGPSLVSEGEEVREILQDLVEISQIDANVEDDEASEVEFMDVVEHVRLSVLSLFFSFGKPGKPHVKGPTLH